MLLNVELCLRIHGALLSSASPCSSHGENWEMGGSGEGAKELEEERHGGLGKRRARRQPGCSSASSCPARPRADWMSSAIQPAIPLFNLGDEERKRGRADHGWWRQYLISFSLSSGHWRRSHPPPSLAGPCRTRCPPPPSLRRPARHPYRRSPAPPFARAVLEGGRTRYPPPSSLRRPAVPPLL